MGRERIVDAFNLEKDKNICSNTTMKGTYLSSTSRGKGQGCPSKLRLV